MHESVKKKLRALQANDERMSELRTGRRAL